MYPMYRWPLESCRSWHLNIRALVTVCSIVTPGQKGSRQRKQSFITEAHGDQAIPLTLSHWAGWVRTIDNEEYFGVFKVSWFRTPSLKHDPDPLSQVFLLFWKTIYWRTNTAKMCMLGNWKEMYLLGQNACTFLSRNWVNLSRILLNLFDLVAKALG